MVAEEDLERERDKGKDSEQIIYLITLCRESQTQVQVLCNSVGAYYTNTCTRVRVSDQSRNILCLVQTTIVLFEKTPLVNQQSFFFFPSFYLFNGVPIKAMANIIKTITVWGNLLIPFICFK